MSSMYGIRYSINSAAPGKAWYAALPPREKTIYAAWWYFLNGKDTVFYSQDAGVRTQPGGFKIPELKAWDCSSAVSGWLSDAGYKMSLTTGSFAASSLFETIPWRQAQPGDIAVTKTKGHIRLIVGVDVDNELLETIEVGRASNLSAKSLIKGKNFPAVFYTSAKVLRPDSAYIGLSRTSYAPGEKHDGRKKDGADDTRSYIVRRLKNIPDWNPVLTEDDEMTQEQFNEMLKKSTKAYNTIEEVPSWAQPTIQKLVAKGHLQGDGGGLALSEDLTRVLVINDRAGIYG